MDEIKQGTSHISGFLRLSQILGDKKKNVVGIFPISKSSWWSGIKTGKYPKPVKLSDRITAWRVEDIQKLMQSYSPYPRTPAQPNGV